MVYETKKEMDKVTGSLADNSFIKQQETEMKVYREKLKSTSKKLKL